jgi:hypothetical protein
MWMPRCGRPRPITTAICGWCSSAGTSRWDAAQIARDCPFRVADPGMHFILLRATRDLGALAAALGQDSAEICGWIATLEAGAEALWNPDLGAYRRL